MKRFIPYIVLTFCLTTNVHVAWSWNNERSGSFFHRDLSESERQELEAERARETASDNERKRYANHFDSLHSTVGGYMLGCKGDVSIYQTMVSAGDAFPPESRDAGYDKIASCIEDGQREILDRYNDLQTSNSEASAYFHPVLQTYMDAVMEVFANLAPGEEDGAMEGIEAYDNRYKQMEEWLDSTAEMVRERIQ